jgi:hypothetical protein
VEFIPGFLFALVIERCLNGLRLVGIDATGAPIPNVERPWVRDAGDARSAHDGGLIVSPTGRGSESSCSACENVVIAAPLQEFCKTLQRNRQIKSSWA